MQATYNALFLGYVKNGKMEDLRDGLAAMKERGMMPTNLSLQTIISGFLDYKRIDDVLEYLPYLKVSNKPRTHFRLLQGHSNQLALISTRRIVRKARLHLH